MARVCSQCAILTRCLRCDTLCCPIEMEDAKTLALSKMYRTYEDATYVLVVDNSIRRHRLDVINFNEACARVLYSPWMRRLWTLQEGALPAKQRRLWFQFDDRPMSIRRISSGIAEAYITSVERRGFASDMLLQCTCFRSRICSIRLRERSGIMPPSIEFVASDMHQTLGAADEFTSANLHLSDSINLCKPIPQKSI